MHTNTTSNGISTCDSMIAHQAIITNAATTIRGKLKIACFPAYRYTYMCWSKALVCAACIGTYVYVLLFYLVLFFHIFSGGP